MSFLNLVNVNLSNVGGALNLTTQATGTLATGHGGTNLTSFTANDLLYASSSSSIGQISPTGTNTFLQWTGTAYQWSPAGAGTVTSVGLMAGSNKISLGGNNPITSSGTITIDVNQGNLSLASIGGSLSLTSQVTGTLPTTSGGTGLTSFTANDLFYASSSSAIGQIAPTGTNTFLQWTGTAYQWAPAGMGTVTSIAATSGDSSITILGSPITTSGTLGLTVNQGNLSLSSIGGSLALATQVSGTLPTTHGGTGLTSFTANDILYASSSSAIGQIAPTGTNTFLQWTGSAYQWVTVSSGSGTVTSVNAFSLSNTISIAGNPITTSGTLDLDVNQAALSLGSIGGALNLASQTTGTLGTGHGGTGLTAFTANNLLYASSSSAIGQIPPLGSNTFLMWNGTSYEWAGSLGVTSVGATSSDSSITISGSPITTSGTLGLTVNQANLSLGSIGGTINLTSQVSNTLPTTSGGTGLTSFTANNLFYASSTSAIGEIAPTGTNTYLQWTGTAYQWAAAGGGSGTVTSVSATSSDSSITITGSPITTSGTLGLTVDQANLSLSSIGGSLALGSQVSGTLGTTHGGTGLTSFTSNNLFYASSSSAIGEIAPTGTNTFLQWTGSAYQWASAGGSVSFPLLGPNDSSSAPDYSWTNATDAGLYLSAPSTHSIGLTAGNAGSTSAGGSIAISAGAGGSTSGAGGAVTISGGGVTSGAGGSVTVAAGNGSSGGGGALSLSSGTALSGFSGGALTITAGNSGGGNFGAPVTITAGQGGPSSGNGGTSSLVGGAAGTGSATGGNISALGAGPTVGGAITITGGTGTTTSGAGGAVTITGGAGGSTSGHGGAVSINAGSPTTSGAGAGVTITASSALVGGAGGSVALQAGAGVGATENGGTITLTSGNSSVNNGGQINLTTGNGGSTGGTAGAITITVGTATEAAGAGITLQAGNAASAGATAHNGGTINIDSGSGVNGGASGAINLSGSVFQDFAQNTVSGAITIDCSQGNFQNLTLSGNVTGVTFTNILLSSEKYELTLFIQNGSTPFTFSWSGPTIKWAGGTPGAVTATANAIDIFKLMTYNGGTTWYATTYGNNFF